LTTLEFIASKHHVSISNVATRWVLDQPHVAGAIIGARLGKVVLDKLSYSYSNLFCIIGYQEHIKDNKSVFSFTLDDEDRARIESVQKKAKPGGLMKAFGDCGGEYRRRA
jgi:diketogulonate reductase-like aldo/keto reductase